MFFALSSGLVLDVYAQSTTFGSSGTGNGQFASPYGITSNSTHIVIVEAVNNRVQIFDLDGTYVGQFGSQGTGNGQFNSPRGIAVNSTHILVSDRNNDRVQIFDHSGNYISQFGSRGSGNGQFNQPWSITTNSNHILVGDTGNHRVQIFDHSGNYVNQFGSQGTGNGQFVSPRGIAVNSTNVLVSDTFNNRVQIFDHSGNYVNQFGSPGTGNGQFNNPYGIVFTSTLILITDTNNNRVQIFDHSGNYVGQYGSFGSGSDQFNSPQSISVNDGNVFVSDVNNNRVHIFSLAMLVPEVDNTDTTAPTFTSAATTSPTTIDVTASEPLAGTPTIGDFTISGNTVSTATISGSIITITVNTAITSTDTVTVALTGTSVTDLAGNALTFTAQSVTNNVSAGPSVSSVTSSGGPYNTGDPVTIIVTFSESVTVTGTPQLTLETGTTDAIVDYASGSPGTALTFTYTVTAGHNSDDLNYVGTDSLSLNSGSIVATTGGATAGLTLPATTSANSLGGSDVVIDTISPTVAITSTTVADSTTDSRTISYTATFSEDVDGFVIGDITVSGTADSSSPAASNFAGSGATYTFDVVTSTDGTVIVTIPADAAEDAADNGNTISNTYTVTVGTPTFNIVRGIVTGTNIVEVSTNEALAESTVTTTTVAMTVDNTPATITDVSLVAGNNIVITAGTLTFGNDIIVTLTAVTDLDGNAFTVSYTLTAQDKGLLDTGNAVSITDDDNVFVIQETIPTGSTLADATPLSVNATLDLSNVLADADNPNADAIIPAAFSITRPGITIELQSVTAVSGLPDSNQILLSALARTADLPPSANVDFAVEIGSPDHDITLDNPARITFSGLSGSTPFYINSAGVTTVITTQCMGDSVGSIGIPSGECFIDVGSNLIVWTYHFTTFGAFGVETSGGSGGNIAQSRSHFGLSPLTDTQLVSCGFSMDGECRDVVDYHVPYDRTVIQTGTTHDFTLKPFSNYNLKMLQLGLGVKEVGDPINTAEALIVVELELDYKSDIGYVVESVTTENNLEDVIDEVTESNVSLSTEPCMPGLAKDCLVVHINDVMFRDVFYSEPFVINVVDTKRLSSTNYLNEGIIVTGESLNPAPEYHLTTGKKVEQAVERLNLVRTDKVNDIWTDNNGNQWTKNNHDTWIQVTFTPYVEPKDPAMSVMTRINNNFDDMILQERERAILVWDSTMIQGEIKPSFSYTFDEKFDKLDDPKILKKLDIESEKALEILRAANYHSLNE